MKKDLTLKKVNWQKVAVILSEHGTHIDVVNACYHW